MVQIFKKNEGFTTQRLSGEENSIRYGYLYNLSHKVISEANLISITRRNKPEDK
jgi:hypothetical protein